MRKFLNGCLIVLLLLLVSGCSTKSSEQITMDLWKTWEGMDELLNADYPDAPPIILIHGWNGGEFSWPSPQILISLEKRLQRDIYMFSYRTSLISNRYPPLEIMEEQLDRFLAHYPSVDIIAHSMGGLLLRQYLSHHAGSPVHRIVFLSTPHFGTNAARILVGLASVSAEGNIQAQEIRPGSDFLWLLDSLQGSEMDGIETLNVYSGGGGWLEGDLVVDPSSAYLPWSRNVEVTGDHHMGRRLGEYDFIINFLKTGALPAASPPPVRRDVWFRFVASNGGKPMEFTENAFNRLSPKGTIVNSGYSVCCKDRAGLYPSGGNTAVVENVAPGESFEFVPRTGHSNAQISANELLKSSQPVQLLEIKITPPAY